MNVEIITIWIEWDVQVTINLTDKERLVSELTRSDS